MEVQILHKDSSEILFSVKTLEKNFALISNFLMEIEKTRKVSFVCSNVEMPKVYLVRLVMNIFKEYVSKENCLGMAIGFVDKNSTQAAKYSIIEVPEIVIRKLCDIGCCLRYED